MDSAFTYTEADLGAARDWAGFQLRAWGVDAPDVGLWLAEATARLHGRTARVVLDHDVQRHRLRVDVWCGDAPVFAADAELGSRQGAPGPAAQGSAG